MHARLTASLDRLVKLSREIGREDRGWVKPREGNTSARFSENTFFVKASGTCLSSAAVSDFTEVDLSKAFEFVGTDELTGAELKVALESIKADSRGRLPSVETLVHAVCLRECTWVAHCYPESILRAFVDEKQCRSFIEAIMPELGSVMSVPYADSGFKLAVNVRDGLRRYKSDYGKLPKVIHLSGHSLFVLGQSAAELVRTMTVLDAGAEQ